MLVRSAGSVWTVSLSGFGVVQSNHAAGDSTGDASLSNCQVFVQKPDGSWQFYVQAGAYNILSLGLPFVSTGKQVDELYGPVPVAYLKLVPGKNTSVLVGALPTLMGAEYTFDFENMNIERGLLWNQENAINRGIQVNQAIGKFAASFSWNDGYYSNRYSWLSGSLTYTRGPPCARDRRDGESRSHEIPDGCHAKLRPRIPISYPSRPCLAVPDYSRKMPESCRDSKLEGRNLLESGGTDGSFERPEERLGTLIAPLSHPRPLPCKPLPKALTPDQNWIDRPRM